MHLFTYGTLMFPEVWRIVVGRQFQNLPATLHGYQIFRVASVLYPGIIKSPPPPFAFPPPSSNSHSSSLNSQPPAVPGLVYRNVDAISLERLDRFEGDDYRRLSVEVTTDDGQVITADTYVIRPELGHLLTDEVWTAKEFAANGQLERFIAEYRGFHRID